MKKHFSIGSKDVGESQPTYIVAELSANHLNDFNVVRKTVEAAAEAGANAIKLATLTPDAMTIDCDKKDFLINAGSKWDGRTLYDLYKETSMPYEWHEPIMDMAASLGIGCFSTPYDQHAADFLRKLDVPAFKIASFEITDVALVERVASFGKPIILSTGIATKAEIEDAIDACIRVQNQEIILLKCTSGYPAPMEEVNLETITKYQDDFDVLVGLSDHTLGIEVPIAATMLGAVFIEKHIILDRGLGGPDAHFSLEPDEFGNLVRAVRNVERARGSKTYELPKTSQNSRVFARSLYVVKNIRKGEAFSYENVRSIRPGHGMPPKRLSEILGKKAARDIERGTALSDELLL